MFCRYCGSRIEGKVRYCPNCGASQGNGGKRGKERKMLMLAGLLAGAGVLAAGIAIGVSGKKKAAPTLEGERNTAVQEERHPVLFHAYSAADVSMEGEKTVAGSTLQGVEAFIREGRENQAGEVVKTAEARDGGISVELPDGVYTVQFCKDGYFDLYMEVEVTVETGTQDVYMMSRDGVEQTAIVLTWDGEETDLDLTLFSEEGGRNIMRLGGLSREDALGNVLVSDNKSRCEVMYINAAQKKYKLYVNDYTDSLAGNNATNVFGRLNARIFVYGSDGFAAGYTAPGEETGAAWEALELEGDTLIQSQKISAGINEANWRTLDKEDNRKARAAFYDVIVNGKEPIYGNEDDYEDEESFRRDYDYNGYPKAYFEGEGCKATLSTEPTSGFLVKDVDGDGIEECCLGYVPGRRDIDEYDDSEEVVTTEIGKVYFVLKYTDAGVEVAQCDNTDYRMGEFLLDDGKVVALHDYYGYQTENETIDFMIPEGSRFADITDYMYASEGIYEVYDDWDAFRRRQFWKEKQDGVTQYRIIGYYEYEYEYDEEDSRMEYGKDYVIDGSLVSGQTWRERFQRDVLDNMILQEQYWGWDIESVQKALSH